MTIAVKDPPAGGADGSIGLSCLAADFQPNIPKPRRKQRFHATLARSARPSGCSALSSYMSVRVESRFTPRSCKRSRKSATRPAPSIR
jgi:hypothetical protein